ncbi:cysteine synthase A [Desulfonatronovibrio hydrogenovorans]|uniref:cysteine synthase A n=1 Tax=Desulfonatronovibrio hydrogenovorans TaxID=53245 RepID=UPI00048BDDCB|nr:cysteine synthase A [Desulfonatronovibrio hydrogenovorans]
MKIYKNMCELVGRTPLVYLNRVSNGCRAGVAVKLEAFNPCFSVKDRIGLNMIVAAEKEGLLKPDSVIIEATSGNTGIALAFVCAVRGYDLILTMPESMSRERRDLLKGFGARLVLTPAAEGMKGAVDRAREILADTLNGFMPAQFDNPANPEVHYNTTGPEIWEDTDGRVDIFVAGVGTGGTVTGAGTFLKEKKSWLKVVAVEPASSAVLSGGSPGPHSIQGIGAGFIPGILNTDILDEVIQVTNEQAMTMAKRLIQEEGILCGISSGAIVHGALELARKKENQGKLVTCIVCDTGERYLSTELFKG